jgi:transcriptional regulator with XRE-family HTH domain
MQAAVTVRDFTMVYRLLQKIGFSQQKIAALTGQSQPEVSAIIHGRKVMAYDVVLRTVEGLGIPRGLAGMSFCRCAGPAAVVPVEAPAAADVETGRVGAMGEHADSVGLAV